MSNIWNLFRIRKTCCEMLEDRGYIVSDQDKFESFESFEVFSSKWIFSKRSRMLILADHKSTADKKIVAFFSDEQNKIGVKSIRELVDKMEEKSIQKAILIVQNALTPFAKNAIDDAMPKHIIECFLDSELLVNITKSEYVPKHVPLTDEEKQSLLRRYKVTESKIPKILQTDPVVRYFGVTKGQILKIIRPSETAGRYVTYRLVT